MTAHNSITGRATGLLRTLVVLASCFFPLPSSMAACQPQQPSPAVSAGNAPAPKPPRPAPSTAGHVPISQRDPFRPLVTKKIEGAEVLHLPPGKAGLTVATLRITGLVRSPNGMIAVASNPESHVFFLHQGDQLYDASVQKIALDGVVFLQNVKDRFGHPVQHLVTRSLYSDSGAQK